MVTCFILFFISMKTNSERINCEACIIVTLFELYSYAFMANWTSSLLPYVTDFDDTDIIVFVITFYSRSCLGQETTKGPFGLRVKLPPAHLSTTHGGGFTLSLLMLNVKQESCEYQFLKSLVDPTGNRTRVYRFSSRRSIHSTTDRFNNHSTTDRFITIVLPVIERFAHQTRRHGGAHRGRAPPTGCLCPPKRKLCSPKQGLCPEKINRLGASGAQIEAQINVFCGLTPDFVTFLG